MTFVAMLVYITLSQSGTFCAAALDNHRVQDFRPPYHFILAPSSLLIHPECGTADPQRLAHCLVTERGTADRGSNLV